MMDLTMTLDVHEIEARFETEPDGRTEMHQQGFSNVTDFVGALVDFFTTAPLERNITVTAEKVVAADGSERFKYNGKVQVRWFDKDGNVVLGMGNGDSLTVLVKNL